MIRYVIRWANGVLLRNPDALHISIVELRTSKSDTGTGTWGLVHLTEDQGDLGLAIKLNDGSLLHFVVQIVTLAGSLTDTSEDGETTVGLGDVVLAGISLVQCSLSVSLQ